ncbi:MAG: HAD-IA family hydrolase [Rhodoferax sp.]|nr:HAD-IA family hydrolase [Rhodoferax sp.]
MSSYDLFLFDLDGTLIETAPEIGDAVNETLQALGLPPVEPAQVESWIGHGTGTLLVRALACSQGLSEDAVRAQPSLPETTALFGRHYQSCCGTRSRLYPQVRETLQSLRDRGKHLAVVTNKESVYTRRVLQAHDLLPLLDRVVSGDSLPTRKPDPAGVACCLAEFGVPADRTLFVGDSHIDVATARNAGVAIWALPYGYNMGQPIADSAPDRIIPDCSMLLNA